MRLSPILVVLVLYTSLHATAQDKTILALTSDERHGYE
jgi:hypothetical protein